MIRSVVTRTCGKRLINPSFYPNVTIPRNYCTGRGLDEAPADQEVQQTEIPKNYYHLRYSPGPAQLLWEQLNSPTMTATELFKLEQFSLHLLKRVLINSICFVFFIFFSLVKRKGHLRYITIPHFDVAFKALYNERKYVEIKALIKYLRTWRFVPTKEHFTYLTVNCARLGDVQRASSHIYNMKKEFPDYTVTAEMYNGHLAFWSKKGKLQKAYRYFKVMNDQGIAPVPSNFYEMMINYCDSAYFKSEEFETIIHTMKSNNISLPDKDVQIILEKLKDKGIEKQSNELQ